MFIKYSMFTICDLNVVDDLWIAFIHGNEKSAPRLEHMRSLPVVVVPTFVGAGMHDLRQLTHISWWDNYHQVRTGQGYFNATTQLIVVVVSVACLLFVFEYLSLCLCLFVGGCMSGWLRVTGCGFTCICSVDY